MKKLAATCLVFIYFTFSAGATIHLHFCMGEFINFSFSDTNESVCGKCGMSQHEENNNCCRDVSVTAKISDSHNVAYANTHFELQWLPFKQDTPAIEINPILKHIYPSMVHYPPGNMSCPLFIQQRSIQI